jgi:hypothetical protein
MKSQLLATLLVLVPVLAAQDDGAQQPPKPPTPTPPKQGVEAQETKAVVSGESEIEILPDGSKIIRTTNDKGEQIEKHIPPGDPAAGGVPELPPDEMARRGGGYFDAAVMVRPRRLAPGESGNLYVHVTLRGHAVVVPGATINLTYAKTQGSLTLGSHELQPAKPGVRETRYKGKPVYDDSLTFKIPLGVDSNAKAGNAPFVGSVLLEVSDGRTGEMIGRFRAEAPGQVLVGRPFPRPVPQVGPKGAKASGVKAEAGSRKVPAAADASGTGGSRPKGAGTSSKATGEGHLMAGQSPQEGAAPGQSGDGSGTASGFDTIDLAFWGVGGLLLLGLALLVLRRR